jgi:hypothetical protein
MGAQEEIRDANSATCRTDASTCIAAAMRLRNRPMWRSSRDELRRSAATSQLLVLHSQIFVPVDRVGSLIECGL